MKGSHENTTSALLRISARGARVRSPLCPEPEAERAAAAVSHRVKRCFLPLSATTRERRETTHTVQQRAKGARRVAYLGPPHGSWAAATPGNGARRQMPGYGQGAPKDSHIAPREAIRARSGSHRARCLGAKRTRVSPERFAGLSKGSWRASRFPKARFSRQQSIGRRHAGRTGAAGAAGEALADAAMAGAKSCRAASARETRKPQLQLCPRPRSCPTRSPGTGEALRRGLLLSSPRRSTSQTA